MNNIVQTLKSFYSFNYLFTAERTTESVFFSSVTRAEDRAECLMEKYTKYVANYQSNMFLCIKQLFSSSNTMLCCVIIQDGNPHHFCNSP